MTIWMYLWAGWLFSVPGRNIGFVTGMACLTGDRNDWNMPIVLALRVLYVTNESLDRYGCNDLL